MIPLTTAPSPVSMSAGVKSSQYTIALTGKTFDVLSSMLYKDPHLAIVRELSCNAYDSHVENGCIDKAFDIHLPNQLEPYFSIRDYGTGMSAEQIDSVYTKFFESTKTHSNDVVGALGLGSKSPFSYTSNYTITSWHGGLKLVYSAFKSTDGIPSIALLDVSDSNDPTGLEVTFAVKAQDFEKFTSKVQSFFTTWGSVPPAITGGLQGRTTLRHVERDFGGTDWFVATANGPLSTALAIQGNVPYPLQRHTISSSNEFRKYNDNQRSILARLLELPIIITFPIGSLDFSASREELQYTEQTTAVILDKLLKIGDSIRDHIQDQAASLPTMWDVIKFCRTLRNDRLRGIVQLVGTGKLKWKGQEVSIDQRSVLVDTKKVEAALAIHKLQVQTNKRRKMEVYPLTYTKLVASTLPLPLSATGPTQPVSIPTECVVEQMSFSPATAKVTVVVFDEVKGGAAKLKYHCLDKLEELHNKGEVLSISVPRGEKLTDVVAFKKAAAELLDAFHIPGSYVKVVFASDLATPPSKRRTPSQGGKPDDTFKVFDPSIKFDKCPDKYVTNSWTVVDEAKLDGYVKSGKFTHIVFVPQLRGVPQVRRVSAVGDDIFNDLSDDFPTLWNELTSALGKEKVLLVGIKTSALESKKVAAFVKQAQTLDTFLRFWLYGNAKALAQSDAYHIEWVNNHGKQNVVLRAVAAITDSKHPTVSAVSGLVNKFICDNTAQLRASANRDIIGRTIRTLRNIDHASQKPDPMVAEISTAVDNSNNLAKAEYANLLNLYKQLETQFPMVAYVNQHFRYTGNDREIQAACAQIVKYITLASV
jgi:hypothetical protein